MYLAARDEAKGREAIEDLKTATGKEALFLMLDLADLRGVRTAAEEFLRYVYVHSSFIRTLEWMPWAGRGMLMNADK